MKSIQGYNLIIFSLILALEAYAHFAMSLASKHLFGIALVFVCLANVVVVVFK